MAQTPAPLASLGADRFGAAAALSNDEVTEGLDGLFRQRASVDGEIVMLLGEADRRQSFREEGATSAETWAAERFGISTTTARAYARLGEKASDIPHLMGSLCEGDLSLDKVRAVAEVATPETDRELCDQAKEHSVRDLGDIARSVAPPKPPSGRSEHDRRFLRFNDTFRTMNVQLPPEYYAETRTFLETRARKVPSDGETPWDQRLCDAFIEIIRSPSAPGSSGRATTASPYFVVVHAPLDALVEEDGEETSLAGELEQDGFIDVETLQRIACDATIVIGVDDDVGHTMYEGRARRFPSETQRREVMRRDRHCRFPGCANVTFTNVHHIEPWKAGGTTDLDNLALLCLHHHHRVHSKVWTMTGNANTELTFVGPKGRVMTTRPSPRWTGVTAGPRSGLSG
jgi:Domain of unknown function (DUF222)/HNH endonuclease